MDLSIAAYCGTSVWDYEWTARAWDTVLSLGYAMKNATKKGSSAINGAAVQAELLKLNFQGATGTHSQHSDTRYLTCTLPGPVRFSSTGDRILPHEVLIYETGVFIHDNTSTPQHDTSLWKFYATHDGLKFVGE